MSVIEKVKKHKILSVIRGANTEQIIKISDALNNGGIHILEITMETENALEVIETAIQHQKQNELIGAGTVTNAETAIKAIQAGAEFIVTPILNVDVIDMCKKHDVVSIIGGLTPTEVFSAYSNGADIVKLFPADVFGPKYIKSISAPLSSVPIIPTGGIDLSNIHSYYTASKIAVGVGSSLVNTDYLSTDDDYKTLERKAKEYSQALN